MKRRITGLANGVVGYEGDIFFDSSKPDGTPRKLVDVGLITALGWRPEIRLEDGVAKVREWFQENVDSAPDQVRGLA